VPSSLFHALAEIQRFDDLEDLLDFACETVVSLGEWKTAFISFYLGDEAAYGACGCEEGMKERFHRSFLRTKPKRREERRRQIVRYAWRDTSICFLPEGEGPSPSSAFVPSVVEGGSWRAADRLMILMRDWQGAIIGVLSLDNPTDGNRPDEAALTRLIEVERFIGLIGKIAENRFWSLRLERSRRRFERAAKVGRNWIWEVDALGRILYASPAVEDLLGHRAEEVVGLAIADLVVESDRPALRAWLERHDGRGNLVSRFRHVDGHEVTLDSVGTATPSSTEEPAVFLGSSRDISQQIRAEQALRASEAAYRGIFESATDAFFILNLEGVIVEANPAACRMHGYGYEELLGQHVFTIIHPDSRTVFDDFAREIRAGGRFHGEAVDLRKDGTPFDVEVYGARFEFHGGTHMLGVVRDITQRKEVFEGLLRQQKDESIATLAGGVAHDFNNYLVGILGSADLLGRELEKGSEGHGLCRQIVTSAEQLSALTQQLIAYARGGRYQPESLSLSQVLAETLALARGLKGSSIRIEMRIPVDLWPVEADRTQLQQILMNLVLNAFDAMEGSGVLRIEAANERHHEPWQCPHTGSHEPGEYVWLRVADTGPGMDEETKARIFEPFFTTKFQGRGLGLAAVLGIVKNHGGAITVESEPGCGASFRLSLPRSFEERAPFEEPESESPEFRVEAARRALVVDDEEVVRSIATAMLTANGWEVLQAPDGPTAIELVMERGDDIDVVLLDVQMPGMGGAAVFDELQRIDPSLPVVLTSGYDETLARKGFDGELAVAGFLPKPYTIEELVGRLEEAVSETQELRGR
jgi:two-component system cell cycle sensor histidine kinase/response regulator CckA